MKKKTARKSSTPKPRNTEVHAYIFIKRELEALGWDTRNPDRILTGQVYTQNECLGHPEIQKFLKQDRPENVVKLSEQHFWVIEAKKDRNQIEQALQEAEDYARAINDSDLIQVKIISGVAGNEIDGFIVESRFFDWKKFSPVRINSKDVTGFIPPDTAKTLVQTNKPEIDDFQVDEALFFSNRNSGKVVQKCLTQRVKGATPITINRLAASWTCALLNFRQAASAKSCSACSANAASVTVTWSSA